MSITKILRDTLIITWIKSSPDFRRNPLLLLLLATVGAIPLFFMTIVGGGGLIVHGLIGAMVSSISFTGVIAGIQDLSWDRYVKIREMIVAMPVHPASYALGIALAPLLLSVPPLDPPGRLCPRAVPMWSASEAWVRTQFILAWASM